jgi:hypothetical protein
MELYVHRQAYVKEAFERLSTENFHLVNGSVIFMLSIA